MATRFPWQREKPAVDDDPAVQEDDPAGEVVTFDDDEEPEAAPPAFDLASLDEGTRAAVEAYAEAKATAERERAEKLVANVRATGFEVSESGFSLRDPRAVQDWWGSNAGQQQQPVPAATAPPEPEDPEPDEYAPLSEQRAWLRRQSQRDLKEELDKRDAEIARLRGTLYDDQRGAIATRALEVGAKHPLFKQAVEHPEFREKFLTATGGMDPANLKSEQQLLAAIGFAAADLDFSNLPPRVLGEEGTMTREALAAANRASLEQGAPSRGGGAGGGTGEPEIRLTRAEQRQLAKLNQEVVNETGQPITRRELVAAGHRKYADYKREMDRGRRERR